MKTIISSILSGVLFLSFPSVGTASNIRNSLKDLLEMGSMASKNDVKQFLHHDDEMKFYITYNKNLSFPLDLKSMLEEYDFLKGEIENYDGETIFEVTDPKGIMKSSYYFFKMEKLDPYMLLEEEGENNVKSVQIQPPTNRYKHKISFDVVANIGKTDRSIYFTLSEIKIKKKKSKKQQGKE